MNEHFVSFTSVRLKKRKMCKIVVVLLLCILLVQSAPIPIKLDPGAVNKGELEFALELPNNDTIAIDLSFMLLTYTKTLNNTRDIETDGEEEIDTTVYNITTTPTPTTTTTHEPFPEHKFVTVEEAIEAFRQDLIRKEREIAGIIESTHPFYRHFKLQFDDNLELSIRCTYTSNYAKRTLNISCYEYHEYETERILSNGEVEIVRMEDKDFKTDVKYIDARNVKQVYQMEIS